MDGENRVYFCIDMKTFYASVECAERGLNPFETDLVVADGSRGSGALCLAISPKMKARGIHNRCRLFEIPEDVKYITALPRMKLYVDYAADIYGIYLRYFAPEDIHVYSIDEAFIDATDYLGVYGLTPKEMVKKLMNEIAQEKHIPSTAGIGTNLFLAKIALDITAKHAPDHMGYLNEALFRESLWEHKPITDFWQISRGTAARLYRMGITDMKGVAECPEEYLYKAFGKDAELLIDHSRGKESCLMEDIKNYRSKSHSVSFSQILPKDYDYEHARIVMEEMILNGSYELMRRKVISRKIHIFIGYSRDTLPMAQGHTTLVSAASVNSQLKPPILALFDRLADRGTPIRRLGICFADVCDEACGGYDLFTDWHSLEREKHREHTVMEIKDKYGKNAVLRGTDFLEGATQRDRNGMIGGHRAGYGDRIQKGVL